jgi:hypothetical protein
MPLASRVNETLRATHQLRSVAYLSKPTRRITDVDLRRLSLRAAQFNDTVDVTGLLLYSGHEFMQTIEGLGVNVEKVYVRILNDVSHEITEVLFDAIIARRIYPEWAMMASLTPPDAILMAFLESRPGFPNSAFTAAQTTAVAATLAFAKAPASRKAPTGH